MIKYYTDIVYKTIEMVGYHGVLVDNLQLDAYTHIDISDCNAIHINYLPRHITWIICLQNMDIDYLPLNVSNIIYITLGRRLNVNMRVFGGMAYNLPPSIHRISITIPAHKYCHKFIMDNPLYIAEFNWEDNLITIATLNVIDRKLHSRYYFHGSTVNSLAIYYY
jgi:hypothetical protein